MSSSAENLVTLVLQDIKRKIVAWEYPPNYQLVEEDLCRIYNVSRSPIRQALTHLQAEGLVEKRLRKGFFVRPLHLKNIEDLYEFRFALELQVVKGLVNKDIAVENYKDLVTIWSELDVNEEHTNTYLAQLDEDFHTELARAYGNDLILSQVMNINERIFIFREIDFQKAGRIKDTKKEHLELLQLIMSKNIKKLEALLQKNLYSGFGNVESVIVQLITKSYTAELSKK